MSSYNVHEILKYEMLKRSRDIPEKSRPGSDHFGISDQYLTLDSFAKLKDSNIANGEFKWNFMVQGVTGDEVVGVRDRVDNVIEIQLYQFEMPILQDNPYTLATLPARLTGADLVLIHNNTNAAAPFNPTLVPNNALYGQYPYNVLPTAATTITPWIYNPLSQLPCGGRITIQLRESGTQSFSDKNGARHNFECVLRTDINNPNIISAEPVIGKFIFTDPIQDLHGLTLVFRNPDMPIVFQQDVFAATIESDGAAGPGPYLRVRAKNHGLNAGDRIYITGASTGNNKLDTYLNDTRGLVVNGTPSASLAPQTPIVLADPDVFYLDPVISLIGLTTNVPVLPAAITLYVAKRRMRLSIRIRRVVERITNYIMPN